MEQGVRHYILDPCDEDSVIEVISKVKKDVDAKRAQLLQSLQVTFLRMQKREMTFAEKKNIVGWILRLLYQKGLEEEDEREEVYKIFAGCQGFGGGTDHAVRAGCNGLPGVGDGGLCVGWSVFSKIFKKSTGTTPGEYREKCTQGGGHEVVRLYAAAGRMGFLREDRRENSTALYTRTAICYNISSRKYMRLQREDTK